MENIAVLLECVLDLEDQSRRRTGFSRETWFVHILLPLIIMADKTGPFTEPCSSIDIH